MPLMSRIKLELHPLRTSALADIKRKVSSDNVVEELLSWITAR